MHIDTFHLQDGALVKITLDRCDLTDISDDLAIKVALHQEKLQWINGNGGKVQVTPEVEHGRVPKRGWSVTRSGREISVHLTTRAYLFAGEG